MQTRSIARSLALIGFAGAFSLSAYAAPEDVMVKQTGVVAPGQNTNMFVNGTTANWWTGMQSIEVSHDLVGPPFSPSTTFKAFCIDPTHFSSTTWQPYKELPVATSFPTKAADIQDLYGHFYRTSMSNFDAAAFQIALWEIANDDKVLTTGVVRYTGGGALGTRVMQMINDVGFTSYVSWNVTTYMVENPPHPGQDFVVANPVPEPETYAMMLAGLGLMGVVARRRAARA